MYSFSKQGNHFNKLITTSKQRFCWVKAKTFTLWTTIVELRMPDFWVKHIIKKFNIMIKPSDFCMCCFKEKKRSWICHECSSEKGGDTWKVKLPRSLMRLQTSSSAKTCNFGAEISDNMLQPVRKHINLSRHGASLIISCCKSVHLPWPGHKPMLLRLWDTIWTRE